jgi:hypothetical protein
MEQPWVTALALFGALVLVVLSLSMFLAKRRK